MDQQLVTGSSTFDHVLTIVGALVPLFSAIVSFFNHRVRVDLGQGRDPSATMLAATAALNFLSINIDKGLQLAKMARGFAVAHTSLSAEVEVHDQKGKSDGQG